MIKKCDVCGHDMISDDIGKYHNVTLNGLNINPVKVMPKKMYKEYIKSSKVHREICRILDTFGKTDFNICFVCLLKALGVKERK